MKLEILKENLKNGLAVSERVSGKNISLPILNNVLLVAENSFLNLISTNLETTIKLWILSKIIKKGRAVVLAKFFSGFISSLPKEKITIEEKENNLYVECGGLKTKIQGQNPEDFPIIPEFNGQDYVEINCDVICSGLAKTVDVASVSQTRPEISGIYFLFSKGIKIASTDSFRLAEKTIALANSLKKEYSFILPKDAAKDIINILGTKQGPVKIYFSQNQAMFEFLMPQTKQPQVQIISRLIDGQYPNYQEIIPNKFKAQITVKKEEFLNQIKTASFFSNKTNELRILIKPEKGEIEISTQSAGLGELKSAMPAKVEGEPLEISFNYKYLIDGLLNIDGSEVILSISKEDGPCTLMAVGDASYLYVVMPIKAM
ncbi:MAG: DNA polymerase III subunit beta [Patescibacteria group bacterium]